MTDTEFVECEFEVNSGCTSRYPQEVLSFSSFASRRTAEESPCGDSLNL